MAAPNAVRGLRLAALLRNFGLKPADVAGKPSKAVVSTLKAEYYRQAKAQHPDHTDEAHKADAAERFVRLNREFQEAVKLLEEGVRPLADVEGEFRRQSITTPLYGTPHVPFKHTEPPQFDMQTRVKGHMVLWSGLLVFLLGFREFLVWSAGSTYAWTRPKKTNEFYVRRVSDEWVADQEEAMKVAEKTRNKKKTPERLDRGLDEFYQKRGISNIRRKTEPRGWGPSL